MKKSAVNLDETMKVFAFLARTHSGGTPFLKFRQKNTPPFFFATWAGVSFSKVDRSAHQNSFFITVLINLWLCHLFAA